MWAPGICRICCGGPVDDAEGCSCLADDGMGAADRSSCSGSDVSEAVFSWREPVMHDAAAVPVRAVRERKWTARFVVVLAAVAKRN